MSKKRRKPKLGWCYVCRKNVRRGRGILRFCDNCILWLHTPRGFVYLLMRFDFFAICRLYSIFLERLKVIVH